MKGKHILITGISGFIGSHLSQRLTHEGAVVFGVSRTIHTDTIFQTDILDYSALEQIIMKNSIQIIIHLAGEALVESGQKDPYNTYKQNIEGTLNILELARKHTLEKVIISSTSHVYGNNTVPYKEEYSPRPSRPYETSKACVDLIAQSYAETFQLPVLIPRFVNIYGPGDKNMNRLVPKIISDSLNNIPPKIWGGEAKRSFLHIDDAVEAYIGLLQIPVEKLQKNRIFNFGSSDIICVKDLTNKIIKLSGKDLLIQTLPNGRSDEIQSQYVSWEKAHKELGWTPKISLDDGLKSTIKWYTSYLLQ